MTTGLDPIPDRAELLARSAQRLHRAVRIGLISFLAVFVALALGLALLLDQWRDPAYLTTMAAGLVAVVVIAMVTVLVARRRARNPTLIWGTDTRTRNAVTRALRAGRTDDPRIDALARATAHESLRHRWYLPLIIALLVIQLILLAYFLVAAEWKDALLRVPFLFVFTMIGVRRRQEVRRQRAYLGEPGPAGLSGTAA